MPTREKTLALCFVEPGRVEMREMSLPAMGPEDVLVEVRVCGVCQFDLHVFSGDPHFTYPMFGGHEAVGVVVETGRGVTGLRPGQPVAVGGGFSPHFAHYMVCHQSSARPLLVPVERFEH